MASSLSNASVSNEGASCYETEDGVPDGIHERDVSSLSNTGQVATQTVFELIDLLTHWLHFNREKVEATKQDSANKKGRSSKDGGGDDALLLRSSARKALLLGMIPKWLLARASFRCHAYTRALKYFESHLREQQRHPASTVAEPRASAAAASHSCFLLPTGKVASADANFLQSIYMGVDDPDGLTGVAALRQTTSMKEKIRDFESKGEWGEALICFEQGLQEYPDQLSFHIGTLRCLRHLNQLQAAVVHAHGVSSRLPAFAPALAAYGIQAAWRLSAWDTVQSFIDLIPVADKQDQPDNALLIASAPLVTPLDECCQLSLTEIERTTGAVGLKKECEFEVALARLLLAMTLNQHSQFRSLLTAARLAIMTPLAAASRYVCW